MMTTGYDCTDLLNVVLMKPIFSVSDFVQIKGRGTRPHFFKNELTGQVKSKDSYHLIDFFGVCEYFDQKYDYKEPLKMPAAKILPEPSASRSVTLPSKPALETRLVSSAPVAASIRAMRLTPVLVVS